MQDKTVMLVDDDQNILTSVSILFEMEGFKVKTFTDGSLALTEFWRNPADLIILDIKMPRIDGVEVLNTIRQKSNVPVIFLTSRDDEMDEAEGLSLGADDYITKPFSKRLLLERVKSVLRRANIGTELDKSKLIKHGKLILDPTRHLCEWNNISIKLTVTEFLVLQSLVSRPGFVRSRDQLMDAAYNEDTFVDDRTIDSHIKRLRKKIKQVDDNFDHIKTLYGIGYKWTEDEV